MEELAKKTSDSTIRYSYAEWSWTITGQGVQDADGKLVAPFMQRTPEELYDKELNALEQIDNDTFCRKSPTVAEYCEKWLLMQSVHVTSYYNDRLTSKGQKAHYQRIRRYADGEM